jgi:hypothetical protein
LIGSVRLLHGFPRFLELMWSPDLALPSQIDAGREGLLSAAGDLP